MPLAELALHAAHRGDDGYDDLLRQLDDVTAGQASMGILGVLVADTRRWAQACHDALAGESASALHHLENMNQPALMRLAAYDRLEAAARVGRPEVAWLAELARFADEVPHAARARRRRVRPGPCVGRCGGGGLFPGGARTSGGGRPSLRSRPHPPGLRRVPPPRPPPHRRPRAPSGGAVDLRGRRSAALGRARPPGTAGIGGVGPQTRRVDRNQSDRPGAAGRAIRRRRPVQPGGCRAAVPQPANHRLPPAQRLRQDRRDLSGRARPADPRLAAFRRALPWVPVAGGHLRRGWALTSAHPRHNYPPASSGGRTR